MSNRQNRTKVGLKRCVALARSRARAQAKSNQGGIETERLAGLPGPSFPAKSNQGGIETQAARLPAGRTADRAKSNQGGIETASMTHAAMVSAFGKIEPRWD